MKTNFKKLALQVGVSASLVAGSMAANAAITSVPAPAQLVPLFYYNDTAPLDFDTIVRLTVPKSVGADTVINILSGQAYGVDNIEINPAWDANSAGFGGTTKVHWFWLDQHSHELLNGTLAVTPDDEAFISAQQVNDEARDRLQAEVPPGTPGYLVLVNDSASNGGAPTFQFVADAWIDNDSGVDSLSLPHETSIPVFAMTDDRDTAGVTNITPQNNVVENNGSPDASPTHTAIRTSTTVPGANVRVVDVPLFNNGAFLNTVVVWADQNDADSLAENTSYICDTDESCLSFTRPKLDKELNFLAVGWNVTPDAPFVAGEKTLIGAYGIQDVYATNIGKEPEATAAAMADGFTWGNSGFLKMVLPKEDISGYNTPTPGAYSSIVMFNLPASITPPAPHGLYKGTELGIDTGFFTTAQ